VQLFTHLCHLNDIYSGIKLCYYLVLVYVSAATTVWTSRRFLTHVTNYSPKFCFHYHPR